MLTIQQPDSGEFTLAALNMPNQIQGVMVAVPLPDGVSVAAPTDGALTIIGAVVMGSIVAGAFVAQLPE